MTEYEEITNGKTTEELVKEINYQLNEQGYNFEDSFPQYIRECIAKLNPNKRQIYIEFISIDDWNRPLYKYVGRNFYLGSIEILFPNKEIAPNGTKEEINKYFQEHNEEFVYFGTESDCDPYGSKFNKDIQFIILN